MTDNNVIKALECCKCDDCDNCPNEFGDCVNNLATDALDLINRQKAEIEKFADIGKLYSEIKAEAIKEFAERLKESAFGCDVSFGYGKEHFIKAVAVIEIDRLVKKKTEGAK